MATKVKPRKAHGNSKLDALPSNQKEELIQGLLCGWTYVQCLDWLHVECGVSVSLSALTPFYARHVEPILVERKKFAALSAKTLGKLAEESKAFDAAAIGELKEYAYRLIRDPNSDPEDARKWMETLIKAQAGTRDERKLSILEAKATRLDAMEAKAKEIKANGGLTPETLELLEKQLKLL
jgi:hypothetical protein